jgi:uncharacterized protein (UPF0548 family)
VFRVPPRSDQELEELLLQFREAPLTYAEVGATKNLQLPDGYRHDRHERQLGGSEVFDRASRGLKNWQVQKGAGASVVPLAASKVGDNLLVVIKFAALQIIAPCRIVYVIDEPERFGFGYGTLPGHPERGEESFVVCREPHGTIFRITAFSRPADLLVRLGSPISRRIQSRFTQRYLDAMARYVTNLDSV